MQRQQDDDTVQAAAIVLAAAARASSTGLLRHQQQLDDLDSCAAAKKTRWCSHLKSKFKWFRPHGHPQRIADASRSAELLGAPIADQAAAAGSSSAAHYYYARHAPQQPAVAFVAPPSSPASSSVLTSSESPSPVVNASSISCYSSPKASIFAIGPYAREPQLPVSPPAFSASAGLTEPSTAPVTPPPESSGLHLLAATTTPSSPEVPFARFLWSSHCCSGGGTATEQGFLLHHGYQLQPGSPVLVSPGSTSSSPPPWNVRVPIKDESNGDEAATDGGGGEFSLCSAAVTRTRWPARGLPVVTPAPVGPWRWETPLSSGLSSFLVHTHTHS